MEGVIKQNVSSLNHGIDDLINNVQVNLSKLVPDQKYAYDAIINNAANKCEKVFFIDAPGETGKTFLINLLLDKIRSTGNIAVAVASFGIAVILLKGGRTAHSTFKLPLNVFCDQDFVCSIRKNGPLGQILQETILIVWDECTMTHRAHIEAIDKTLRDLRSVNLLMGGVTFVFSGNFCQTLPVITKGTRADIVKACLKSSQIWNNVETLHLRTNMRAYLGGGNPDLSEQLLKMGNGTIDNNTSYIHIEDNLGQVVSTLDDLISKVYPDIENLLQKSYLWLCERAIISPRNALAEEINHYILGRFNGDIKEYLSIDTIVNTEDVVHYPQEFLNSLHPAGFPPHNLKLKIGTPIILLRNFQPPNLCNGTRLQVKVMRNNITEAIILTGPAAGETAFIPRIPMIPTDMPFQFKRLQFPIKLSFAISINQSQGQTYN